jgi:uncharacterized Zn finger protein (UPF0148 family)
MTQPQLQPLVNEPLLQPDKALRSGDVCPRCGTAKLDYDGLLNLACPACGFAVGGCFS